MDKKEQPKQFQRQCLCFSIDSHLILATRLSLLYRSVWVFCSKARVFLLGEFYFVFRRQVLFVSDKLFFCLTITLHLVVTVNATGNFCENSAIRQCFSVATTRGEHLLVAGHIFNVYTSGQRERGIFQFLWIFSLGNMFSDILFVDLR